jgi:hypothetical protein
LVVEWLMLYGDCRVDSYPRNELFCSGFLFFKL